MEVKQRNVGSSGLRVSSLGLSTSTWGKSVDVDAAKQMASMFIDAGGTLVDTSSANSSSEEVLAEVLRGRRDKVVLSTASGVRQEAPLGSRVDCSRRGLITQLDATLQRLGTDHVDLWSVGHFDQRTPPEEVASTLEWAVRTGRARYAGVRGYAGWQLAVTGSVVATQNEYSLLRRDIEEELIPAANHLGVGVIASAPLAQGVLSARPDNHLPAEAYPYLGTTTRTVVGAVETAAEGLNLSSAAVALAWVRERAGIDSVIIGASGAAQLKALLGSVDVVLPASIHQALDDVSR